MSFKKNYALYEDQSLVATKDYNNKEFILALESKLEYLINPKIIKEYNEYFGINDKKVFYLNQIYNSPIYFKSYKESMHNVNNFSKIYNLDINLKYRQISYSYDEYIIDKHFYLNHHYKNQSFWNAYCNIESNKKLYKNFKPDIYYEKKIISRR